MYKGNKVPVKIIKRLDGATIPKYATPGSAGFDLIAHNFISLHKGNKAIDLSRLDGSISKGYIVLRPHERVLIGTGLFVELPEGYEIQIRPRSGHALKRGLTVLNSPGTIDPDFRGELGVIMYNSTQFLSEIKLGEAIAQGIVSSVYTADWEESSGSTTQRGEGGFGHTSSIEYF